jgi:superfamily I DNA/RNA helicase
MMLCRLTAPLVAECIRLIKAHIPARVRGHDIGKQLADMVKAVTKLQGYHFDAFGTYLTRLEEIQRSKLIQHDASESQLEALADRVEAIRACHEEYECRDADDLARQIESLFADETNGVMLSTVHRAKGLENPRVFILKPEKLPLVWPKQQEWEAEQELHIKYVALTRATEALIFIRD